MYQCICHTCDVDEVVPDFARAQAYFTDHADRGCEVVLRNRSEDTRTTATEMSTDRRKDDDSRPADD